MTARFAPELRRERRLGDGDAALGRIGVVRRETLEPGDPLERRRRAAELAPGSCASSGCGAVRQARSTARRAARPWPAAISSRTWRAASGASSAAPAAAAVANDSAGRGSPSRSAARLSSWEMTGAQVMRRALCRQEALLGRRGHGVGGVLPVSRAGLQRQQGAEHPFCIRTQRARLGGEAERFGAVPGLQRLADQPAQPEKRRLGFGEQRGVAAPRLDFVAAELGGLGGQQHRQRCGAEQRLGAAGVALRARRVAGGERGHAAGQRRVAGAAATRTARLRR